MFAYFYLVLLTLARQHLFPSMQANAGSTRRVNFAAAIEQTTSTIEGKSMRSWTHIALELAPPLGFISQTTFFSTLHLERRQYIAKNSPQTTRKAFN
jgi:hypothetical protein